MKKTTLLEETNRKQEKLKRLINSYYLGVAQNMTKRELAEAAGYTPEYLSRLFSGKKKLTDEAIRALAPILGVREEYLMLKDDYMWSSDFKQMMEVADSYAEIIQSSLTDSNILYTGYGLNDLPEFEKIGKNAFIQSACNNKERIFVNVNENTYITPSEAEYKEFCDEIKSYIQFRAELLFKKLQKHYI